MCKSTMWSACRGGAGWFVTMGRSDGRRSVACGGRGGGVVEDTSPAGTGAGPGAGARLQGGGVPDGRGT
jgi:hypothetical protein